MARTKRLISEHSHTEIAGLPATGENGQYGFKDGILYIYATMGTVTTWFPMNRPQSSYVHVQGTPSVLWNINHGLKTKDIIVMAYDTNHNLIDAGIVQVDDTNGNWHTEINLTVATAGYAVVFGTEELSAPQINTDDLAVANTLTVGGVTVATLADLTDFIRTSDTIDLGSV